MAEALLYKIKETFDPSHGYLLHDRPGALGEITLDTTGSRERKTKTLIIYLIIDLLFCLSSLHCLH